MRNDDKLIKKWTQKRIVRDELTSYKSKPLDCSILPSKTDQSQARDCDVNFILQRFKKTGVLPGINAQALYADVSDAPSYQEALNTVLLANDQFNALDAPTRKKFGNDPSQFLEFVHDPKNAQELINMGLATQRPTPDVERLVAAINASKPASPAQPKNRAGQAQSSDSAD